MDIAIQTFSKTILITLTGDLDSSTTPIVEQRVVTLVVPGSKLILDMSKVGFMSSIGLRVLLLVQRKITEHKGSLTLVGVSEKIKDTMLLTGFLKFFTLLPTLGDVSELKEETF